LNNRVLKKKHTVQSHTELDKVQNTVVTPVSQKIVIDLLTDNNSTVAFTVDAASMEDKTDSVEHYLEEAGVLNLTGFSESTLGSLDNIMIVDDESTKSIDTPVRIDLLVFNLY
jgi:hypothetical protein